MSEGSSHEPTLDTQRPKSRFLVWLFILIALVAGGWYGYTRWSYSQHYVYTDNAQISGVIVKVLSPENGYVEKLKVSNNQTVNEGELLVQLSDDFYQWEVQRAQAQFNILQSRVGSDKEAGLQQAQLTTAQANLEVIQSQMAEAQASSDKASSDYNRKLSQFNAKNINQNQLDMAKAKLDQANGQLNTLQKEAYAAQQQVIEAEATGKLTAFGLDSAKADLQQAQQRLSYTSIKSPVAGAIAKMTIEPGVLVEPGQYLMSVVSTENVWVVANIEESDFMRVQAGARVTITVDAFPGKKFEGIVHSTSPATGSMFSLIPKDNASGNFIKVPALIPVRIDFVGLPQATYSLLPGMSAEVIIEVIPPKPREAESSDKDQASPAVAKPVSTEKSTPPPSQPESQKTTDSKPASTTSKSSSDSTSKTE